MRCQQSNQSGVLLAFVLNMRCNRSSALTKREESLFSTKLDVVDTGSSSAREKNERFSLNADNMCCMSKIVYTVVESLFNSPAGEVSDYHAFSFCTCVAFLCFLAAGLIALLIVFIPPR